MTSDRRSIFREAAKVSGLATAEDIDRAVQSLQSDRRGPPAPLVDITDDQLAAKMVELELLTPYQTEQLKDGLTKFNLKDYVIIDWIGQGGMGRVFKAEHRLMGRVVAIKVLPRERGTPDAIANFEREIRTQAKLDHPNLVRAYDAGHDGNVYFLVTEYVPGTDLRALVRNDGPLTEQNAATVIMQAAQGLHYAHERGLIHRDIKPGNLLVTPDGMTKVSDLGLAGFVDDPEGDPRAGKIVGTLDFLSPELIRNPREITPASDIYSLGCTLFYAITGKVPFPGGQGGRQDAAARRRRPLAPPAPESRNQRRICRGGGGHDGEGYRPAHRVRIGGGLAFGTVGGGPRPGGLPPTDQIPVAATSAAHQGGTERHRGVP